MPHVSKNTLPQKTKEKIDKHILEFLSKTTNVSRKRIFKELFTKTERLMIGKRLVLLVLISDNVPTHRISRILKMSPSTVARFENLVEKKVYIETIKWLKCEKQGKHFFNLLKQLATVPFEAQNKSLRQIIDGVGY